jgi:hypothetical protein
VPIASKVEPLERAREALLGSGPTLSETSLQTSETGVDRS